MAARLRWIGRRLADFVTTFVDAFLRNNKVLPPVLAVLALFIIAWVLAGAFMGGSNPNPVAHKSNLAQSDNGRSGGNFPPRGVENRDVNSYAAYRSKDPFREILAPEGTTTQQPTTPPPERTTPETTTGTPGGPGAGRANPDTGGAGAGTMPGTGPSTSGGARPPGGRRDNLLNSGGILPVP